MLSGFFYKYKGKYCFFSGFDTFSYTVVTERQLERPSRESEAQSPPRQFKTISSAVVNRAIGKLRARKMDLMNALKKGRPSDPSATNTSPRPRPSLMERRATAHTYEVSLFVFYCFHQIIYICLWTSCLISHFCLFV